MAVKIPILNHVRQVRDFILDLIFPIECLNCAAEGAWLCPACLERVAFRPFNSCFGCKRKNLFGEFCLTCRENNALDGIWIAGDYDNKILSELVRKLKYYFIKDIAKIIGNFMSAYLSTVINCPMADNRENFWQIKISGPPFIDQENTLVIPVPLHKKRERWRGFNQAELLARIVADNFRLAIDCDGLARTKNNRPQANLNEAERQKNISGCFFWRAEKLSGQTVILVDDIATTSATLNECAKVLKAGGAGEVWGLVAAKG